MRFALAWRILTYDKGRTALAVAGVFLAIVLVFVQLGFFIAVPQGGMLLYDRTRFDLLIASTSYEYQVQPGEFPLSRLDRAKTAPEVALAAPLYFGSAKWRSGEDGKAPDVFVIGLDPRDRIFASADINLQLSVLDRTNTVLVDSMTRSMFGPLTTGRTVEIDDDKVKIGGNYVLGTGFMGLGVILVSAQNFVHLFPYRQLDQINLGLIQLKPGVDPDHAAASLRALLGGDTRIFTRPELETHETAYWTTRTSVGLLFGSGLIISFIVGVMVVYQILATQVSRQLPQFATLKAVGYGDRFLNGTVIIMALLIVLAGFFPALAAALGVYAVIREETLLPVEMSGTRIAAVFVATLAMAAASALLSMSSLRRADPADLFG
ncbi:MAG: FtsX-like permease family protein [Alphaproteobacteria bacterium]|nr:FtsX-like permease family protein [Alphaproteobacteria bacterium]